MNRFLSPDSDQAVRLRFGAELSYGEIAAVLGLRMAEYCNGVSQLHGQTARKMWSRIWPGLRENEVPISMCGQMCANPVYTMLLLGMGLRSLSLTPAAIPEIKQVCRKVSIPSCQRIAERALELETAQHVRTYLKEELTKALPELPV